MARRPSRSAGDGGGSEGGDRATGTRSAPSSRPPGWPGARRWPRSPLESGLTKGFVSKLERDQATASVASLMRLCQALGIQVGSLFHASPGEVVRGGAYPPINFGGIGMARVPPHAGGRAPRAGHPQRDRARRGQRRRALRPARRRRVRASSSRAVWRSPFADHTVVLETGDAFTFPPRNEHCFRSTAEDATTRVLWVFAPALPPGTAAEASTPIAQETS